jgi:hypothetical protein
VTQIRVTLVGEVHHVRLASLAHIALDDVGEGRVDDHRKRWETFPFAGKGATLEKFGLSRRGYGMEAVSLVQPGVVGAGVIGRHNVVSISVAAEQGSSPAGRRRCCRIVNEDGARGGLVETKAIVPLRFKLSDDEGGDLM